MSPPKDFNKEASSWSTAEFQGYMTAKIESILEHIKRVDDECERQWDTIGKCRNERTACREQMDDKLRGLKVIAGITDTIIMLATGIFVWFFKKR